jgi:tetratricopeptide (TPR) repeat protein
LNLVFRRQLRRFIVLVTASSVMLLATSAAAQTAPAAAELAKERLQRVATDLFSATPRLAEDIKELKAILAVEPGLAEAHLLLGIAYRAQGSPEMIGEAVAELRQAISLNPSLILARLTLARVYLDTARATRARQELEGALEQTPGHPQLLSVLGETERQLGNPQRSVELNQQALKADPSMMQARYYLGLALLDLRQHAAAIRELETVAKSGANAAEAYLGLGTAYLAAGRATDGIAALREAAARDPSRHETHLQLARAYRIKGLLSDALKELKLALPSGAATLNTVYSNLEADVYMEEGLIRLAQGRLEAAAAAFQKVLDLDASNGPAKQQLELVQKRLRERKKGPEEEELQCTGKSVSPYWLSV